MTDINLALVIKMQASDAIAGAEQTEAAIKAVGDAAAIAEEKLDGLTSTGAPAASIPATAQVIALENVARVANVAGGSLDMMAEEAAAGATTAAAAMSGLAAAVEDIDARSLAAATSAAEGLEKAARRASAAVEDAGRAASEASPKAAAFATPRPVNDNRAQAGTTETLVNRGVTANAAAQFQDIVVSSAAGMSPIQVALQQGTQLASVVAMMERPAAGLLAAFTALLNPVALVTIGITGAAAAAISFFSTDREADALGDALARQNELLADLAANYRGAETAAKAYAAVANSGEAAKAGAAQQIQDLRDIVTAQSSKASSTAEDFIYKTEAKVFLSQDMAPVPEQLPQGLDRLREATERLKDSMAAGEPNIAAFRNAIGRIAIDPKNAESVRQMAQELLKQTLGSADAAKAIRELQGALAATNPAVIAAAAEWERYRRALDEVEQASDGEKLQKAYETALGLAGDKGERDDLGALLQRRQMELQAQYMPLPLPDPRKSPAFDDGTQAFVDAAARQTAAVDAQTEALRRGGEAGIAYDREKELLAEASARFGSVSDDLAATIHKEAAAYAAAETALAGLRAEQQRATDQANRYQAASGAITHTAPSTLSPEQQLEKDRQAAMDAAGGASDRVRAQGEYEQAQQRIFGAQAGLPLPNPLRSLDDDGSQALIENERQARAAVDAEAEAMQRGGVAGAAFSREQQLLSQALGANIPLTDQLQASIHEEAAAYASAESHLAALRILQQQGDALDEARLELQLAGQSEEVRARALALLRAEQQIRDMGLPTASAEAQRIRDQAVAIEETTQATEHQRDVWNEIENTGSSAIDKLVSGLANFDGSWKSVGDTAISVLKELEQEMLKLALINPLKNWLFGESLPTLGDVAGKLFGRSGTGTEAAKTAATKAVDLGAGGIGSDAVASARALTPTTSAPLPSTAGDLFAYARGQGFNPAQASALIGNAQQESGFNPAALNEREGAFGLFQWRLDRRTGLEQFAAERGVSASDPRLQMDWLKREMSTTEAASGSRFLAANDVTSANSALRGFIRYGDNSEGTRLANSQAALGQFDGASRSLSQMADAAKEASTDIGGLGQSAVDAAKQVVGGTGTTGSAAGAAATAAGSTAGPVAQTQSLLGSLMSTVSSLISGLLSSIGSIITSIVSGLGSLFKGFFGLFGFAEGGQVPLMVSAGEWAVPPEAANANLPLLEAINGGGRLDLSQGGAISGPGSSTSDSIAATAPSGTYIVNAAAAAANKPLLEAMTWGRQSTSVPRFARGGVVGVSIPVQQLASGGAVAASAIAMSPASGSDIGSVTVHNYGRAEDVEVTETPDRDGKRQVEVMFRQIDARIAGKYGLRPTKGRR